MASRKDYELYDFLGGKDHLYLHADMTSVDCLE
jgi:hypothetical protein